MERVWDIVADLYECERGIDREGLVVGESLWRD